MNIIKLLVDDNAKFHFGDATGSLKVRFSSDQLVSALMNNVSLMYGKKELDAFTTLLEEERIHFSSLLYGLDFLPKEQEQLKTTLYFLPRPKVDFVSRSEKFTFVIKEMKKIAYVSLGLYELLSSCWDDTEETCPIDLCSIILLGNTFAVLRKEIEALDLTETELKSLKFLQINTKPGVEVGRTHTRSENFYFREELEIKYEETANYIVRPFLYFIYQGEFPSYLNAAINLLTDEGIGGQRSLGKGLFKSVKRKDGIRPLPQKGRLYMNLSTYFPKKDEIDALHIYELEKRNGFIYSFGSKSVRRKSVMVISEGSLLTEKVQGQLINVQPTRLLHPVYLYAKPMLVGFGGENR